MSPKTATEPIPEDIVNHPSIQTITAHIPAPIAFDFSYVTPESNSRKATGVDYKNYKILKNTISGTVAKLINFRNSSKINQPLICDISILKHTERSYPSDKKKDPLDKQNYRPISMLPFISKLFEKSINFQISTHFESMFNPFINAFRPGMGCQSTLLRLVEDWRKALDSHKYVAAILMDLTKALDCLPHNLLLGKLFIGPFRQIM